MTTRIRVFEAHPGRIVYLSGDTKRRLAEQGQDFHVWHPNGAKEFVIDGERQAGDETVVLNFGPRKVAVGQIASGPPGTTMASLEKVVEPGEFSTVHHRNIGGLHKIPDMVTVREIPEGE